MTIANWACRESEMNMRNTDYRLLLVSLLLSWAVLLQACASKSSASTTPEHIRGTIQSVDGQIRTVSTGSVRLQWAPSPPVATVSRSDRSQIKDGTFLGIVTVTDPDGSQRAVEVQVFAESMRGFGEGSRAWDWTGVQGGSKMTNGTAAASKMTNGTVSGSRMTNGTVSSSKLTNGTVTAQDSGSSLTLQYKNGASGDSQEITIPPGSAVVGLDPGTSGDLHAGTPVFINATRNSEGALTANAVLAGRDGVVPPM